MRSPADPMCIPAHRAGLIVCLMALSGGPARALDWLKAVPLENGAATVDRPPGDTLHFLRFGEHSFAPDAGPQETGGPKPVLVAPFQQLWLETRRVAPGSGPVVLKHQFTPARDAFWDQLIIANPAVMGPLPRYSIVEAGAFGSTLPAATRRPDLTAEELGRQEASLVDPVIPALGERETPWSELAGAAWPLDFQKVLLASANDPLPAFAFQNGQWFTTWPSQVLPAGCKEDHWFAPCLLIGEKLVRPAPLSARTSFVQTPAGVTVPLWTVEWSYEGVTVRQRMFSHRRSDEDVARVYIQFQLENAPSGTRLALGSGRRPSSHYWDEIKAPSSGRSPVPYFSVDPRWVRSGRTLFDNASQVVLVSAQPFEMESLGPLEALLIFETDPLGSVYLETPQAPVPEFSSAFTAATHATAEAEFMRFWSRRLEEGAQVQLPSTEWQERIEVWRSQVESITRVEYDGRERLSYGAYFYQDYFGIEEAWPVIALAQWGRGAEAQRQAGIMLRADNLDKSNVHHQSRNGIAPLAAATVARLTNDGPWLGQVSAAMIECARWTGQVRGQDDASRPALTRGLLPPHIYGGDVRDPATSLYATAACWRGMLATADAFKLLGTPELVEEGNRLAAQAADLQARLAGGFHEVTDRTTTPAFVPFALALPSLGGRNEGPYDRLTGSRYGNYWNLFAPSFLELDFRDPAAPSEPNQSVFDYAQRHGGLWAGQPRFNAGLDAAYAIGNLGYLLERSTRDLRFRPQALDSLQAFMLHASSRNGHTIPEVAGLFPYRLQAAAYERLVRESPWTFGMYDAERYLAGHISFTEPLGAAAGAALTLVRGALLSETRNDLGLPDGGLVILPAVPADWLADGKQIVLENMPTFYGKISAVIRSRIGSRREVVMDYQFSPFPNVRPDSLSFRLRVAPPGKTPQEITFKPVASGSVRARF